MIVGIAIYARRKVKGEADFLVAGRKLSLPFACATLFTTWFGAGTLLTATEVIRESGLSASALEPYGAGFCLIIAGLFFARPLWQMKLLTLADFFRIKFGRGAEELSILLTWPGFVAWIAVQLMAAAEVFRVNFGLPLAWGIPLISLSAMSYIIVGGMWTIAFLDIMQIGIILVGLSAVGFEVLAHLGGGSFLAGVNQAIAASGINESMFIFPKSVGDTAAYLNVFLIAALGNIPGQDFAQRVFSAKSAKVATRACLISGVLYIFAGSVPVLMGLASRILLPDSSEEFVIMSLARHFASPFFYAIFTLAVIAAIFSTLDSSMLAAASPIAHNILRRYVKKEISSLRLCQITVFVIGLFGIILANLSTHMYSLLEAAYSSTMAVLFAPLVIGLFFKRHCPIAVVVAMLVGAVMWVLDIFVFNFGFSTSLIAAALSFLSYYAVLPFSYKKEA